MPYNESGMGDYAQPCETEHFAAKICSLIVLNITSWMFKVPALSDQIWRQKSISEIVYFLFILFYVVFKPFPDLILGVRLAEKIKWI